MTDSATRTILIAGTDESSGKTAIGLALGRIAERREFTVGYMKPRGTRLQSNVGKTLDQDPMLAREVLDIQAEMHEMEPIVYSPTFIEEVIRGREKPAALADRVRESHEHLQKGRDLMLIEGASAASTGAIIDMTDENLADLLDADVVLVAPYEEIRDTDGVLSYAQAVSDRLAGVIFNGIPSETIDALDSDIIPFLEERGVPVLGVIPRVRELAGVTVATLASELGAEVVTETPTDAYVERFMVGAMGGENALRHFRRAHDAVVVTGGDRADIITAALEAPGVRAVVLTGGINPPGRVVASAEERDVPLLRVRSETVVTIDRIESIIRSGRTRDLETVEVMERLLLDHADVDALIPKKPPEPGNG